MTAELTPIDIRHVPELAPLVEEVRVTRTPRRITRDNEDIALLVPVAPPARRQRTAPTPAAIEAAIALAGAWRDQLDPETFKRERRVLQVDDKPPVEL